jgi:hypothetical protein
MKEKEGAGMSTSTINIREFEQQARLLSVASQRIGELPKAGGPLKPQLGAAMWAVAKPYLAMLTFIEGALESGALDQEMLKMLLSQSLKHEAIVDALLENARAHKYRDNRHTAPPLQALEACAERIKDCMVALEATLDPDLDGIMAGALQEHQRGRTVPLESLT